jgi:acyl-CoA synthetase (NDP forming)
MRADFSKLDRAFNPKVVAVIGDSGMFQWIRGLEDYKGKIYSVQVNQQTAQQIETRFKIKNYSSVVDIPESVDFAIVAVNRRVAIRVLDDLIKKDVAAAHFFTSGYSETDTEEGRQYERELKIKAEAAKFHLIGPNCMGLFNPRVGLKQQIGQYHDNWGPVSFISQSGTHAMNFGLEAHLQGIDLNKSVSFGNGTVLDSAEFLAYLGQDEETKIISMYLEGLKEGRRFGEVLKKVSAIKPVVIWKGGRTAGGARAIASHTGSMAVPYTIWEDAMRQFGAVSVKNMEELVDTIKALLYLEPMKGNRMGLTGGSGGQSVAITDAFNEEGLDVPRLSKESYDELSSFFNLIGGGYGNPIDTGNSNRAQMNRIMGILEKDPNIDNIVLLMGLGMGATDTQDSVPGGVDSVLELRKRSKKPVMATVYSPFSSGGVQEARRIIKRLQEGGVPAFSTIERAAKAVRNAMAYYRFRGIAS